MLFCAIGAYAQEEVHATFENPTGITWDSENWVFSWTSQWGNQLHNIGLPNGDLSEYEKLVIDCNILEGDGYRFMFYANDKGTQAGGLTIITESGKHEYNLADFQMDASYLTNCSEICLSGYNASGSVKVNDVYLVKGSDPLATPKANLTKTITLAKYYQADIYTDDSFEALTSAISDAEDELDSSDATVESLNERATAITEAITALVLAEGYNNVTKDMYFQWDWVDADANQTGSAANACELNLNNELGGGGLLYGNGSVLWNLYADITGATELIFEGTPGVELGVRMNRLEVGNGSEDPNGGTLTQVNVTIDENGLGKLDLSDYDYVHINAIKRGWGGVAGTIVGLVIYDPLVKFKDELKSAIGRGKGIKAFPYTESSFNALQTAIEEAQSALKAQESEESLTEAKENLLNAIENLEMATGYKNLTKAFFYNHENANDVKPNEGCSYVVGSASDLPYGLSNVHWLNYADLSDYDQLVVTVSAGEPRFCFNRTVDEGQDSDIEEESNMIDIPNKEWCTSRYETVEDGNTVFTINLKDMMLEKGFAHLHCIKGRSYGQTVTVTGLYLYGGITEIAERTEYMAKSTEQNPEDGILTSSLILLDGSTIEPGDKTTTIWQNADESVELRVEKDGSFLVSSSSTSLALRKIIFEGPALKMTPSDGQWAGTESEEAAARKDEAEPAAEPTRVEWVGNIDKVKFWADSLVCITKIRVATYASDGNTATYEEKPRPGEPAKPALEVAANIAAFKALADSTEAKLTLTDAVVTFVNGKNIYLEDATGAIVLYDMGLELTESQKLNGLLAGKTVNYFALPEMVKTDSTKTDTFTAEAGEVKATTMALADICKVENLARLITISNVTIDVVDNNIFATSGDEKLQVYNKFKVDGLDLQKGNVYTSITGILVPWQNKETLEITYELAPRTLADLVLDADATGISELAGEKAAREVYNLNGQRVNATKKSLYIINGKKVMVK